MKLLLAQINTTVGDFSGNALKMTGALAAARRRKVPLVIFPELATTGYPPEDLLFRRDFIDANLRCLKTTAAAARGVSAIVGFVDRDAKGRLYNAAASIRDGRVNAVYRKRELPNYGVFDEKRYFQPGNDICVVRCDGEKIGITICEDIWQKSSFAYSKDFKNAVTMVVNLSASPYHIDKQALRKRLVRDYARALGRPVAYLNLVGGQDELVFDGGSLVMDGRGRLAAEASRFQEDLLEARIPPSKALPAPVLSREEEVYRALVLGTRDYVLKNGFKRVLIGLSGGIDSALVARIAVDALGPENVIGVTMPSIFSSAETLADAKRLADNLDIPCLEYRIDPIFRSYLDTLHPSFEGLKPDTAEENLQARVRGNLLMALSNKFGHLVLTTGNKSELATGYCTLYGDMAGGFAVIKDVPKTLVFKLSRYANTLSPRNSIPESILRRPPTAELRHGQKDQDTLPPYPELDRFLERYIESDRPASPASRKLAAMVDLNEYKRRQAPPGIKTTPKAFGRDRRRPITNRFRP